MVAPRGPEGPGYRHHSWYPRLQRVETFPADVRVPDVDRVGDEVLDVVGVFREQRADLRPIFDPEQQPASLAGDEGPRADHLSLGEELAQIGAVAVHRLLDSFERSLVLQRDEGIEGHAPASNIPCGACGCACGAGAAEQTAARPAPPPR